MRKIILIVAVNFITLFSNSEILPSNLFFLSQDINDIGVNIKCQQSKIKSQIMCDLVTYFASQDNLKKCTVETLTEKITYKKTKNENEYIRRFVHRDAPCVKPVHTIMRDRRTNKWTYVIKYDTSEKSSRNCPPLAEKSLRDVELLEVSMSEFAMKCD